MALYWSLIVRFVVVLSGVIQFARCEEAGCESTSSLIHCVDVKGKFLPTDNNKDIDTLMIFNSDVIDLTVTDFSSFPHLKTLEIINCSNTLSGGSLFVNLPHLLDVRIEHCNVTEEFSNLFENNKGIAYLSLTGNRITSIRKHLLEKLTHLETVDFSFNEIREIEFGAFDRLTSLKMLNLSFNRIGVFERSYISFAHSECAICKMDMKPENCSDADVKACTSSRKIDQLWWQFHAVNIYLQGNPICSALKLKEGIENIVTEHGNFTTYTYSGTTFSFYEPGKCLKHEIRELIFIDACGLPYSRTVYLSHVHETHIAIILPLVTLCVLVVLLFWLCTRKVRYNSKEQLVRAEIHSPSGFAGIRHRFTRMVKRMMNVAINPSGDTALHDAARRGDENLTERLLNERAGGANIVNARGDTPLHVAAREGNSSVAKHLLDKGAHPDVQNLWQYTPLHVAAREGHRQSSKLLLGAGANAGALNRRNDTPLHVAAREGHTDIAQLLLDHGAAVDAQNEYGDTPLHIASWSGSSPTLQLLLSEGAVPNALNQRQDTPLHNAARKGHLEVARLLLAHSEVCVNAINIKKDTPLHKAARGGHKEIVELLLEHDADFHMENMDGDTPLDIAHKFENVNVVQLLKQKGSKEGRGRVRNESVSIDFAEEGLEQEANAGTVLMPQQGHHSDGGPSAS